MVMHYREHGGQLCIEFGSQTGFATLAMECQRLEQENADLRDTVEELAGELYEETKPTASTDLF